MKRPPQILFAAVLASVAQATAAEIPSSTEPIRIGHQHQLFLDDHLIEHSEHVTRRVQQARKHEANPLLLQRAAWEPEGSFLSSVIFDDEGRSDHRAAW